MTDKQLIANQRRRLQTIRKQLLVMSEQWADVDEFNLNKLVEVADQVQQLGNDLAAPDREPGDEP